MRPHHRTQERGRLHPFPWAMPAGPSRRLQCHRAERNGTIRAPQSTDAALVITCHLRTRVSPQRATLGEPYPPVLGSSDPACQRLGRGLGRATPSRLGGLQHETPQSARVGRPVGGTGGVALMDRWCGHELFPQRSRRRSVLRAGEDPSLSNYRSVGKALSTMGPSGIRWSNQGRLGSRGSRRSLHGRHASSRRRGWQGVWDWLTRSLSADRFVSSAMTTHSTGHRLQVAWGFGDRTGRSPDPSG